MEASYIRRKKGGVEGGDRTEEGKGRATKSRLAKDEPSQEEWNAACRRRGSGRGRVRSWKTGSDRIEAPRLSIEGQVDGSEKTRQGSAYLFWTALTMGTG